jgi:hypothetical protein
MLTRFLSQLTQPEIQDFLFAIEGEDESAWALKQKEVQGIPPAVIAAQLKGRRKAKNKIPTWYRTRGIVYPPAVNLEQASSEATALFKKQLLKNELPSFRAGADLTGGAGIDATFLAPLFVHYHYVEPDQELIEIARLNHQTLGLKNLLYHNCNGQDFLARTSQPLNFIYIDPSRRNQSRKVFRLADGSPDVTTLQDAIFKLSSFAMVKASPLLDIQQGLRELKSVKKIWVVSVENECREILFFSERKFDEEPQIIAVELSAKGDWLHTFSFRLSEEKEAGIKYHPPEAFLYEPFASVMKAGGFKSITRTYPVNKISANTHLYTAASLVTDFPGRVFRILTMNPTAKQIQELLPNRQVNIISRNYPLSPEEIKKKYHLKDGGPLFLIGFGNSSGKSLALCERL